MTAHFNNGARGFATHVMDGILVTQPVGALDLESVSMAGLGRKYCRTYSVVHVPSPVIFSHVLEAN